MIWNDWCWYFPMLGQVERSLANIDPGHVLHISGGTQPLSKHKKLQNWWTNFILYVFPAFLQGPPHHPMNGGQAEWEMVLDFQCLGVDPFYWMQIAGKVGFLLFRDTSSQRFNRKIICNRKKHLLPYMCSWCKENYSLSYVPPGLMIIIMYAVIFSEIK